LPGGVKLVMLPKTTRGSAVNAAIRLNFGDEKSMAGKARVASLTAQMLMRGTKSKTREQIQDQLGQRPSQMNVLGGAGNVAAQRVRTRGELGAVLALALEVLHEPSFPDTELETLRSGALASLEAARSEPQAVVGRAFARQWNPYPATDVRYTP